MLRVRGSTSMQFSTCICQKAHLIKQGCGRPIAKVQFMKHKMTDGLWALLKLLEPRWPGACGRAGIHRSCSTSKDWSGLHVPHHTVRSLTVPTSFTGPALSQPNSDQKCGNDLGGCASPPTAFVCHAVRCLTDMLLHN